MPHSNRSQSNGRSSHHRRSVRIACVQIAGLALEVLRRDHPEWRDRPLAVVERERADGKLLLVDPLASHMGLRRGMRYGPAQSRVPGLRAGVVSPSRIDAMVAELTTAMQAFSPRVDATAGLDGTFLIDPNGLEGLYGDLATWAKAVHGYLTGRGLRATIVIGFSSQATTAIANAASVSGISKITRIPDVTRRRSAANSGQLTKGLPSRGVIVLTDEDEERSLLCNVGLDTLALPHDAITGLAQLDIHTVGDLLSISAAALTARFGVQVGKLHALVAGTTQLPLAPAPLDEPISLDIDVEPADDDLARLLFAIKGGLHEMLLHVTARAQAVGAFTIELLLEDKSKVIERVEPGRPTREAMMLIDLARLRLGNCQLQAKVERITLRADIAKLHGEQLALLAMRRKRDRTAGSRALARIRAAFGDHSVTRASLRAAHLPEARFRYEAVAEMPRIDRPIQERLPDHGAQTPPMDPAARATDPAPAPPLVRRLLPRPRRLEPRDPRHPEAGPRLGERTRLFGPYRVSGGWWAREVSRDYYYAETEEGDLLYIYFDHPRQRWFLHGSID